MSTLSTHVLDTSTGRPAEGLAIVLEQQTGAEWRELAKGLTNADGRVKDFLGSGVSPGIYRLSFDTAAYFRVQRTKGFYPQVQITFELAAADEHYHVPLLLSPFGFSTYRGS